MARRDVIKAPRAGAFLHPRLHKRSILGSLLVWAALTVVAGGATSITLGSQENTATSTSPATESAHVRYVIDGDSLILRDGRHVRLIGINAPEFGRSRHPASRDTHTSMYFGKEGRPDQPLARAARTQLAKLTEGRRVILTFGEEHTDRYRRTLAHVSLPNGTDVQNILLKQGLAWTVAIPPNIKRLASHLAAEQKAHNKKRGVWNHPAYVPLPAERLTWQDTGFHLIQGKIRRTYKRSNAHYFELAPNFNMRVKVEDWKYFSYRPEHLLGRRILLRGWLTEHKGRLRVHVHHPAMLTLLD